MKPIPKPIFRCLLALIAVGLCAYGYFRYDQYNRVKALKAKIMLGEELNSEEKRLTNELTKSDKILLIKYVEKYGVHSSMEMDNLLEKADLDTFREICRLWPSFDFDTRQGFVATFSLESSRGTRSDYAKIFMRIALEEPEAGRLIDIKEFISKERSPVKAASKNSETDLLLEKIDSALVKISPPANQATPQAADQPPQTKEQTETPTPP